MSKKNKCVGLDCEMCDNTKCPNEEKETITNGIDLSKYFKNHYDSWGRLYCIEYKGNPLELQNAIKRLQEENKELKARLKTLDDEVLTIEITPDELEKYKKYKQALEEIRDIAKYSIMHNSELNSNYQIILQNINEVLNDRD